MGGQDVSPMAYGLRQILCIYKSRATLSMEGFSLFRQMTRGLIEATIPEDKLDLERPITAVHRPILVDVGSDTLLLS